VHRYLAARYRENPRLARSGISYRLWAACAGHTLANGKAPIVRQPEKIMTGAMLAIRVLSPTPDFRKYRLGRLAKAAHSSDERKAAFAHSGINPESLQGLHRRYFARDHPMSAFQRSSVRPQFTRLGRIPDRLQLGHLRTVELNNVHARTDIISPADSGSKLVRNSPIISGSL